MLVLSRKCSQSVRIGDEVRITIVRMDRGRVRVGIEAPDHVTVWREELDQGADDFTTLPARDGLAPADRR